LSGAQYTHDAIKRKHLKTFFLFRLPPVDHRAGNRRVSGWNTDLTSALRGENRGELKHLAPR
jgi:hypothetical protein